MQLAQGQLCFKSPRPRALRPFSLPRLRPILARSAEVQELGTKILQAALALHDKVVQTFRKTAVNHHYE